MHEGSGEFMPALGVALAMHRIPAGALTRIARAAFDSAAFGSKKRVAAIHQASVLRISDGLSLECVRRVAAEFPGIAYMEVLVDAAAAHLVRDPGKFDVVATANVFGDIPLDLAFELAGDLGLAGPFKVDPVPAAQVQHRSAPDIAGQDRANPVSMAFSLKMVLRRLGETGAADRIKDLVPLCRRSPETRTADLGGKLGTSGFTKARMEYLMEAA